jgi:hypothetical protein
MITNIENAKNRIHKIANIHLNSNILVIPTIYGRSPVMHFSHVNWRFAGGFFFGDKESILEFDKLYQNNFLRIIKQDGILTWEVNIWEVFENFLDWKPIAYYGSHNDTMFQNIPFDKIEKIE